MRLQPNEYRCAVCCEIFEKGWSDEEAVAELGENWPDFTPADCELVCDDCFHGCQSQGRTKP